MRRRSGVLAIAMVASLWCAAARSDPATSKAAADALFREAVALADQGQLAASVQKFEASYELDPARGTLQGWAMAEEQLGRLLDAQLRFQRLLELSEPAGDARRAEFARERLASLKVRVPTLILELGGDVPRGTKLTLDDVAVPAGAAGSALPVNPGDHRIVALAPDGRRFARMISVSEGARARVRVSWVSTPEPPRAAQPTPRAPPPAPDAPPPTRAIGLAVGALGLAVAGVGTYLWFDAGKDYDAVSDRCPDDRCPSSVQSRIDRGKSKEVWSQALLIGGGLAVAGGVTLFVIGNRESPAISGRLGPGGPHLRGRF
ncbi:MAG: hypothetical protein HYZ29_07320 [Myxococcales bacterium]|nr:hypothetical protein [Myxococcales bacterium]